MNDWEKYLKSRYTAAINYGQVFDDDEVNFIKSEIMRIAPIGRIRNAPGMITFGGLNHAHSELSIVTDKLTELIGHDQYHIKAFRAHIQYHNGWKSIHSEGNTLIRKQQRVAAKGRRLGSKWIEDWKKSKPKNNPARMAKPWLTFMFPLTSTGSTVYFKQRYHGTDNVQWYNGKGHQELLSNYEQEFRIDDDDYQKYLAHMPREWLNGLSIERAYEWEAGHAIANESIQLHVPGNLPTGIKQAIIIKVSDDTDF
jgi:hypothetical protein